LDFELPLKRSWFRQKPDAAIPARSKIESKTLNPTKVRRDKLNRLTDLPNIGPSLAADLVLIGLSSPKDLVDRDPYEMYRELSVATNSYQDPCVLDVFISITRFMAGEDPKPWWEYTPKRKLATQSM